MAQQPHATIVAPKPSTEIGHHIPATQGIELERTLLTVYSSFGAITAFCYCYPIT